MHKEARVGLVKWSNGRMVIAASLLGRGPDTKRGEADCEVYNGAHGIRHTAYGRLTSAALAVAVLDNKPP